MFLLLMVVAVFMITSAWMAQQLYAKPYDDLPTFYWATYLAFEQGASAYQPAYFQELGQVLNRKIYPLLYPPPSLLLFSPVLLCVDYEQCKTIFSIFNLLLWWALVWTLYIFYLRCIQVHTERILMGVLILFFSLVFMPLTDTLKNGQVNLIVLLCIMPLLIAPVGGGWQIISGLLFAFAIILKVYVLLLLPVMLVFGRWREVIASLVCLVLLASMSIVLLPQSMWQEWFELGRHAGYGKGIPRVLTIPFNQSANGFFIRLFLEQRGVGQPMGWTLWIYGFAAACGGAVVYAIFKYLQRWQEGYTAALALVLLLITLIAPLTWLHHYVFALPAIIWSVVLLQQAPSTWQKGLMTVLFLLATGVLAAPYIVARLFASALNQFQSGRGMAITQNLVLSTPLVAAMVIFILFLWLIVKRGRYNALR